MSTFRGIGRCFSRVASLVVPALLLFGCGGSGAPEDMSLPGGADLAVPDLAEPPDGGRDAAASIDLTLSPDLLAVDGPPVEAGPTPCKGTAGDCGQLGACASCANSTFGHQCVNTACGCLAALDCDPGKVCAGGKCSAQGCDANRPCNGGCCDNGNCVAGTESGKCGINGKICSLCGAGTPTCAGGVCASACVAGQPGAAGVCGPGFCCGANDQCTKLSDGTCGLQGAICADCAQSGVGPRCVPSGACGCGGPADCPKGEACKAGVCGAACDVNAACNGGCCSGGMCQVGNTASACAVGGAQCAVCANDPAGTACVTPQNQTFCGCKSQVDCPPGLACDAVASKCTKSCDANRPCSGGCCSDAQNGLCVAGTASGACGANGGVCGDCTKLVQGGKVCFPTVGGGFCGCNNLNECAPGASSCDVQKHLCDYACSVNKPCLTGCCSGVSCVLGQAQNACGKSGACVDCAGSVGGKACRVTQTCGCDQAADCPAGQACDLVAHTCTTKCSVAQPCNGGCCANGVCAAGKDPKACGGVGGLCVDCGSSVIGKACQGGLSCGCTTNAECDPFQACDPVKKLCTSGCNPNQICKGGCCSNGQCVDGTANSGCGTDGKACLGCAGQKPTCEKGACTATCGALGNGTCSGGNCCAAQKCVAGNAKSTCGGSGACQDCTGLSVGQKCIAPPNTQNWTCGCDAKTDCIAADPLSSLPGQACDTTNRNCTSVCGVGTVTLCNDGCCQGNLCRPGTKDGACGKGGGLCNSCSSACQPGPRCDPGTGLCGCFRAFSIHGDLSCNAFSSCLDNGANRYGCNLSTNACCVPGISSFKDNGNPVNCCTGESQNGVCTCRLAGESAGMPQDEWNCCALLVDAMGNCSCRKTGVNVNFGAGVEPRACCSLKAANNLCVAAAKNEPCQTSDGCAQGLTCQMGKCA
ncbi:MAG: hypothetical protein EXR72_00280 [Myxococcales bacterium]|nr:hypothetical protein [Myxococcales bacterium]